MKYDEIIEKYISPAGKLACLILFVVAFILGMCECSGILNSLMQ